MRRLPRVAPVARGVLYVERFCGVMLVRRRLGFLAFGVDERDWADMLGHYGFPFLFAANTYLGWNSRSRDTCASFPVLILFRCRLDLTSDARGKPCVVVETSLREVRIARI